MKSVKIIAAVLALAVGGAGLVASAEAGMMKPMKKMDHMMKKKMHKPMHKMMKK